MAQPSGILPDTLVWVLPDSRRITSNFCELRSGRRYHAGIDFGTAGVLGLPVLSPVDGWVHKVYTSFWGYGKQIVIMSDSGRQYLFAHLQSFRDDIEEELLRRQQESGTYFQDFTLGPDQYRVRKGQRIADCGDTGSGPAHLHMEIRQGEGWALNPFTNGVVVPDHKPPLFQELALLPADAGVTVQGSLLPVVVPLSQGKSGWQCTQTLTVTGPVRLALRAVDKVDGSESRLAPYRIRLLAGKDTLYNAAFEEFPFALNNQVVGEINRWLNLQRGDTFRNLWPTPGDLPFARPLRTLASRPTPAEPPAGLPGVIRWANPTGRDSLSLKLELEDAAGNASSLRLKLNYSPTFTAEGQPRSLPAGIRGDGRWSSAVYYMEGDWAALKLPYPKSDSLLVMSDKGNTAWPLAKGGKTTVEGYFRYDTSATWLQLACRQPDGNWLAGPRWHVVRPGVGKTGMRTFHGAGGNNLVLGWDGDTFVEDQTVLVEELVDEWLIGPPDLRIIKGLAVGLSVPEEFSGPEFLGRTAVYRKNGESLAWAGNDSTTTGLAGTAVWPGRYTVAADITPPRIAVAGKWAGKGQASPLFQFTASDNRSGIQDVLMWIDGVRVFARLDPEAGRVLYRPRSPLPRGEHRLRVTVVDTCGNQAEWNGLHTVK